MDYIIGAGAILESEPGGGITPAALHAQVDPVLAQRVAAAVVDFEGTSPVLPMRLLAVVPGMNAGEFREAVTAPLRQHDACSLADVLRILAHGAGSAEVHFFAHWLPDDETLDALAAQGIAVVGHPLESIQAASIVAGQRFRRVA
jgi:hypothetical protein